MCFDTAYQNTGLSESRGFAPTTPKSVTKHKRPIGGVVVPLWKRKKRAFQLSFSLSLRQSLGHTSVLRSVTATAYVAVKEKSVVTRYLILNIHFFILQEVHKLSVLHYVVLSYECLQGLFYLRDLGACQLREVRNIKAVDGLNLSLIILSFL